MIIHKLLHQQIDFFLINSIAIIIFCAAYQLHFQVVLHMSNTENKFLLHFFFTYSDFFTCRKNSLFFFWIKKIWFYFSSTSMCTHRLNSRNWWFFFSIFQKIFFDKTFFFLHNWKFSFFFSNFFTFSRARGVFLSPAVCQRLPWS